MASVPASISAAVHSGVALHDHVMPATGEFEDAGGRHRDPILVDLQLPRDTDLHSSSLLQSWTVVPWSSMSTVTASVSFSIILSPRPRGPGAGMVRQRPWSRTSK